MTRILVTGGTGLLAPYVAEAMSGLGQVALTARRGAGLTADLTDRDSVGRMISLSQPDVVVHCAAMTDVERCEREPEAAMAANGLATRNLAAALEGHARLVVVSTDQVYPDVPGPHAEGTEAPVNAYGRSKLMAEWEAAKSPGSLIVRTNLFGPSRTPGRQSLSDWIERSLSARQPITLFNDVYFSPLHMATLAATIADLVREGHSGVFNVGSRGGKSKAEFGLQVAQQLGIPTEKVSVGPAKKVADRAPRTSDLRLTVGRVEAALGRAMPTLDEEISKL